MPEHPHPPKAKKQLGPVPPDAGPIAAGRAGPPYAELHARTNFSFLRGASHAEELVKRARELGYRALAITDEASLAGVVRAHVAAKACDLKILIGSELRLLADSGGIAPGPAPGRDGGARSAPARSSPARGAPARKAAGGAGARSARRSSPPVATRGPRLLLHARDRAGYANLSRLLTLARRRVDRAGGEKASAYDVSFDDVASHASGLLATFVASDRPGSDVLMAARVREVFGPLASVALELHRGPDDRAHADAVVRLAARLGLPLVATNDVHCHVPERRRLAAVLACIRETTTLADAGRLLFANGERHLRPRDEIERLYRDWPGAVARTVEVADMATFVLDELRYEYPEELVPPGETPASYLRALTAAGARERFPGAVPEPVQKQIEHELALVAELGYEPYFLTVHDIVRFARSRGILCQGRGSAANSAVCFCLGITSVDPSRIDVLFERFVSRSRREPPDIDVDFEHERREEVLQYVYEKYGRDRAGIAAEVITYRGRSAVRDVGKALGLSLDQVDRLAKNVDWDATELGAEPRLREAGLDPADATVRLLVELSEEIQGFPRHLSQHVGGMVIARGLLSELVPIQNASMPGRTFIEWDKDDLDALGLLKVDCLALGMLTCLRKGMDLLAATGGPRLDLATIPAEDPLVYDMLCRADAVGVFQVESRAQMNMLPRLRPRCFYDLVVEVSIVRPGPIQGGIVHPYLRRRRREEPVLPICPEADRVLHKTLGVPIFQEQAMRLAIDVAGFTPDEADALRKAMGAWRKVGSIERFRERFLDGVVARGVPPPQATELFDRIHGFGEYGFPESHAASFSLLVYASAWLKCHHPAAFAAGLLNAQPMGFYQPAQIVRDVRDHGVEVRPVCVQASGWDTRLEPGANGPALRLGMRLVKGLRERAARAIERVQARGQAPVQGPQVLVQAHPSGVPRSDPGPVFRSLDDLVRLTGLTREPLERLAEANAFASLGLERREAVFEALSRRGEEPPLFAAAGPAGSAGDPPGELEPVPVPLPPLSEFGSVAQDYATVGLTLGRHPVAHVREALDALGARPARDLGAARDGERVSTAGIVICRQRPQTASGIVFFTIEDETGTANLIVKPEVFERFRRVARGSQFVLATGRVERDGDVIHVLVRHLSDTSHLFRGEAVAAPSRDFH